MNKIKTSPINKIDGESLFSSESNAMKTVLVLSSIAIFTAVAIPPPSYIKSCSLKKSSFDKCALESANYAMPHIVKGDRKRLVLPMNPLFLPLIEIIQNGLSLTFRNLSMHGAETLKVTDIKMDKARLKFTLNSKNLTFIGQYELDGTLNFMKLKGSGPAVIKVLGGTYTYDGALQSYQKNEETYVKYNKPLLTYIIERVYFQFDKLLDVKDNTGIQPNKVLNDNWDQVLEEIDVPLKEVVSTVVQSIVNSVLDDIPEKSIFPN